MFIAGVTSLGIEFLQMFGGRYAEIDDLLVNTFGALFGYGMYVSICGIKKNRKKAFGDIICLCLAFAVCFAGIYAVGNNEKQLPDSLYAVESNILEVNVHYDGEKQTIGMASDIYNSFTSQISNCGGHILEPEDVSGKEIWNKDCFIEIIYDSPQSIFFKNAENFCIENADRLLYNASQNILYWGCSDNQNYVEYARLDEELESHRKEILEGYERLSALIIRQFEP